MADSKVEISKWKPFLMLYYREYRRFTRVLSQTVITPLINSSLYLLIFGVSLGASIKLESGVSYLAFLIPGLIMMGCLNNSYQNSSSSITNSKFHGDLQDLRITPLSFSSVVWAVSLGGLTRGIIVGFLNFIVGFVFLYFTEGQVLTIQHPFILSAFLIVGGICFAHIGIAVAFWAKTFDQLSAVGSFILLPLMYLGGVFYSLDGLHPFWQSVSKLNPLLYLINGVRYGMLGFSDVEPYVALGISVIFLVILHILALQCVKRGRFNRF